MRRLRRPRLAAVGAWLQRIDARVPWPQAVIVVILLAGLVPIGLSASGLAQIATNETAPSPTTSSVAKASTSPEANASPSTNSGTTPSPGTSASPSPTSSPDSTGQATLPPTPRPTPVGTPAPPPPEPVSQAASASGSAWHRGGAVAG